LNSLCHLLQELAGAVDNYLTAVGLVKKFWTSLA
jgi:hypothetical protein